MNYKHYSIFQADNLSEVWKAQSCSSQEPPKSFLLPFKPCSSLITLEPLDVTPYLRPLEAAFILLLKSCFLFLGMQSKWSNLFFQIIIFNLSMTATVFPSVISCDLRFVKEHVLSVLYLNYCDHLPTPLPLYPQHPAPPPRLIYLPLPLLCTWTADSPSLHWGINTHCLKWVHISDHFPNLSRTFYSKISSKVLTTNIFWHFVQLSNAQSLQASILFLLGVQVTVVQPLF